MPKRVDKNQAEIVAGLREYGASVLDIHAIPKCFDILVGYRGLDYKIEIKSEHGKLTDDEIQFANEWKGQPIYVVHDLLQAIDIITQDEP